MRSRPVQRTRARKSTALFGTLTLVTALFGAMTPSAAEAADGGAEASAAAGTQTRWVFDYSPNGPQEFIVPDHVTKLTMIVTGGAGATPNSHVGRGGAGGMVMGRFTVAPQEHLTIWVGQGGIGGGGWGWGCGGDHGHAPDSLGRDGGGGGGASAVTKGAFRGGADCETRPGNGSVFLVGGGGGGGGGDGYEVSPNGQLTALRGGDGGDGGLPAHAGADPEFDQPPTPATGGCGGCESGRNGGNGGNSILVIGGGGGGGGGGYHGGGRGEGSPNAAAGAGGGASYLAANSEESFFHTGDAVGNGQVVLTVEEEIPFGTCEGAPLQIPTDPAHPMLSFQLEGAQGGQPREGHGGAGGRGGSVDGEVLLGPNVDNVELYVGCYGQADVHSGWGWSNGGSHGVANTPDAYTGGSGGGSTAVALDGDVQAVAGAGGAGGGNADGSNKGGAGGHGGLPAHDGSDGEGEDGSGGDGGDGGCESTGHGGGGGDADSAISGNGGGGGGGGGYKGGCGGSSGDGALLWAAAGGGGGGGSSWVSPDVLEPVFGTSDDGRDGLVILTFGTAAISPQSGSKQRAELNAEFASPLTAIVTDATGDPIAGVEVEFDLRGDGAGHPSGTFGLWDNHVQTERVTTGSDGIARSSVPRAGINPGSWTAKATLVDYEIGDSAHFALTNEGVPTSTSASVAPRPALAAAPIALNAEVTTGIGTAHGVIDFWIDGVKRYTGSLVDGAATATYTPTDDFVLLPGEHTLVAVFEGDEAHAHSTGTTTFSIVTAPSVTTITSSQNPATPVTDLVFEVTTAVPDGYAPLAGYDVEVKIQGRDAITGTLDQEGRFQTAPISMSDSAGVTATVSGHGPVAGSSASLIQYIGDEHVGVVVSSSVNPAAAEQPVEFTASLTAPQGGPEPTGQVTFTEGSTVLCVTDLVGTVASCTAANPSAVGPHEIVATYGGDGNYAESSGHLVQNTAPGVTVTTIESTPAASSVFGQPVSVRAHVALADGDTADGEVTGSVTFAVDGEPAGAAVPIAADGTASTSLASLGLGAHEVTAVYSGSPALLPSSAALEHDVQPAQTEVELSASAEPSTVGQAVTFQVTVGPVAPGVGTPTGSVQFQLDGDAFGTPVALDNGSAVSPSIDSLERGTHPVSAVFTSSAAAFESSEATISHAVLDPSSLVLTSSKGPSVFGEVVTFTAVVTPATSDGSVRFTIDGATATGCDAIDVSGGIARCTVSTMSAGPHPVEAFYTGALGPSSAQLSQVVEPAGTVIGLTSTANPSQPGQSVQFTAAISSDAGQPVGGTIQFVVDGVAFGLPVPVIGDTATSSSVDDLAEGEHAIEAVYSGDDDFMPGTGELSQWVGVVPTTISVASSADPATLGEPIHFTATIEAAAGPAPAAVMRRAAAAVALPVIGQVQFSVDGMPLGGPLALVGGVATSPSVSDLAVGDHIIVAEFTGAGFAPARGELTQQIAAAPPGPPGPPGPPHGNGGLPLTGGDPTALLAGAALLLLLGGAALLGARMRRRRP